MSLVEEAVQFGGPAPWSEREGVWRRRGQEVLMDEEHGLCFHLNLFDWYCQYSDGILIGGIVFIQPFHV